MYIWDGVAVASTDLAPLDGALHRRLIFFFVFYY